MKKFASCSPTKLIQTPTGRTDGSCIIPALRVVPLHGFNLCCFNNLHIEHRRLRSVTGFALGFDFVRDLPIRICSNIMKWDVGKI